MTRDDRGSTVPLILGFFILAAIVTAGAVAAGDAVVQHAGLQSVCDGAAAAGAAASADLDRDRTLADGESAPLDASESAISAYFARDPSRRHVTVQVTVRDSGRRLDLTCAETTHIAFGRVFGRGAGVRHVVHSSARAALTSNP